jgi:TetR/AcrR family transcriptional repressor of bet genes
MPRPSNTEERRAQIVRGMRRVLAKVGYERASIADIARAAGLTQGLVHYHFKNKLEILETLAADLVATRAALLDRKLADADPRRALDVFIDHHLRPGEDADPEALACWIVLSAEALREPRIKRAFALGVHELSARAEQILRDGVRHRRWKRTDFGAAAAALVALIQGYYTVAAAAPNAIPRGSAHEECKRMMRGLLE